MGIRNYRPTSPSRRHMTGSDFSEITKSKPEKKLLKKQTRTGGRGKRGNITCRHKGGGHRQRYRVIDWKRTKSSRCRPKCRRSSTTRTAVRASRC